MQRDGTIIIPDQAGIIRILIGLAMGLREGIMDVPKVAAWVAQSEHAIVWQCPVHPHQQKNHLQIPLTQSHLEIVNGWGQLVKIKMKSQ